MKKAIVLALLLSLPLFLGTGAAEAVDIGGEFSLWSGYDFDEDDHAETAGELELDFRTSTFTEAFNVTVGLEQVWPEGEADITLKEAYFDYYGEDYDLRLGKQLVSWGTAAGFNPTDNINPADLEDPTGDKDSLLMMKGDYFFDNNYRLTGVVVPYHQPLLEGELDAPEESPDFIDSIPIEETVYDLSSMEYALKLSGRGIEGYDFSFSLYHGHEKLPTVDKPEQLNPDVTTEAYYQRLTALGADVITDYEGVGLWAEGAYMLPEDTDNYGSLVLGADYHLESGQLILGQLIYRHDREGEDNFILQSAVEGTFADYHEARMAAFYNVSNDSYLLKPEVEFSLADAVNFNIEYIYQSGDVLAETPEIFESERNELKAGLSYAF